MQFNQTNLYKPANVRSSEFFQFFFFDPKKKLS